MGESWQGREFEACCPATVCKHERKICIGPRSLLIPVREACTGAYSGHKRRVPGCKRRVNGQGSTGNGHRSPNLSYIRAREQKKEKYRSHQCIG